MEQVQIQSAEAMKALLSQIVKALVDNPEQVKIEENFDADSVTLVLSVAIPDIGKVIGKQGRTARSLRTILGAASMKLNSRVSLDIRNESASENIDA